jgi:hypothetical protein
VGFVAAIPSSAVAVSHCNKHYTTNHTTFFPAACPAVKGGIFLTFFEKNIMKLVIFQDNIQIIISETGAFTSAVEQTFARNISTPNGLGRIDRAEVSVDQSSVWLIDESTVTPKIKPFAVRTDIAVNLSRTFRQLFPAEFNAAETALMTKKYSSQNN